MGLMFVIILVAMIAFFGLKRSMNFIIMLIALYLIFNLMMIGLPFLLIIGIYFLWRWNRGDYKNSEFFRTFNGFEDFNEQYQRSQSDNSNHYSRNQQSFFKDMSRYYRILGLEEGASEEEVKKAYKTLAKKYHPDLHHDKDENEKNNYEKKFKEINDAYNEIVKKK